MLRAGLDRVVIVHRCYRLARSLLALPAFRIQRTSWANTTTLIARLAPLSNRSTFG